MVVEQELRRRQRLLLRLRPRRRRRWEQGREQEQRLVVRCFASFELLPSSGDEMVRRRWVWQSGELRLCLLLEPFGQEVVQRLLALRRLVELGLGPGLGQ